MNGPTPLTAAELPTTTTAIGASRAGRLSTLALVLAGLLLLGTWGATLGMLSLQRDETVEAELRQNANLASVLQEQTLRVLAGADQALLRLRDQIKRGEPPDLVALAGETGLAPRILVQLSHIGPDGRFRGSNLDPDGRQTGAIDLSDREHVRVHLGPEGIIDRGLFISKPVLGKVSQRWTIQLSRRISAPDGHGLGVVVASLDPAYFEDVFGGVALGRLGSVALVGQDQVIRARVMGGEHQGMGSKLSPGSPLVQPLAGAMGRYSGPGMDATDPVDRIHAWHQVGTYPLRVSVATATDEVLDSWRTTRTAVLGMAALISLAVVGVTASIVLGLRRLEQRHSLLAAREQQARLAHQAQSRFLARLAQQLRRPLNGLLAIADELPADQAGVVRMGTDQLNQHLLAIQDLALIEAGQMHLRPEPEPLRPLLREVAEALQVLATQRGQHLQLEVAPAVPDYLHCDAARLRQLLEALVRHALLTGGQGRVLLGVQAQDDAVVCHVEAPGSGEATALTGAQPFALDTEDAEAELGPRLAMALAQALARRMGGQLLGENTGGSGHAIRLVLPIEPPPGGPGTANL